MTIMNAHEINRAATEDSSEANNPSESIDTAAAAAAEERRPHRRGFAAMDRDRVKEIASKGGKAAHAAGTAHQFSSDEARNAGRKGGMAPHARRGGLRRLPSEGAPPADPTGSAQQRGERR